MADSLSNHDIEWLTKQHETGMVGVVFGGGWVDEKTDWIGGLLAENEKLRAELAISDRLIEERNRVLTALECPIHGQCVPGAIERIVEMKAEVQRLRDALAALEGAP